MKKLNLNSSKNFLGFFIPIRSKAFGPFASAFSVFFITQLSLSSQSFAATQVELQVAIEQLMNKRSSLAGALSKTDHEIITDSLLDTLQSAQAQSTQSRSKKREPFVVGSLHFHIHQYRNAYDKVIRTLEEQRRSALSARTDSEARRITEQVTALEAMRDSLQNSIFSFDQKGRFNAGDFLRDDVSVDEIEALFSSLEEPSRTPHSSSVAVCSSALPSPLSQPAQSSLLASARAASAASAAAAGAPHRLPVQSSIGPSRQQQEFDQESFQLTLRAGLYGDRGAPRTRRILTGQGQNLALYKLPGDGDCALHGLGISRSQMVHALTEAVNRNDQEVIENITQLIQEDPTHPKTRAKKALTEEATRERRRNPSYRISAERERATDPTQADLLDFIRTKMSKKEYYLYYNTVPIVGRLFGIHANIWQQRGATAQLERIAQGSSSGPRREVNLFLKDNHFDALIRENDWTAREAQAGKEQALARQIIRDQRESEDLARELEKQERERAARQKQENEASERLIQQLLRQERGR